MLIRIGDMQLMRQLCVSWRVEKFWAISSWSWSVLSSWVACLRSLLDSVDPLPSSWFFQFLSTDFVFLQPDFKAIKKRIEDLITRDYLERDKDNPNLFRYLAWHILDDCPDGVTSALAMAREQVRDPFGGGTENNVNASFLSAGKAGTQNACTFCLHDQAWTSRVCVFAMLVRFKLFQWVSCTNWTILASLISNASSF